MSTPAGDGHVGDATITVNANTTPASLAIRGFTRDAEGRLRDLRGRFVSESRLINNSLNTVTGGTDRFKEAVDELRGAALLLSPALIPVAVQAAPIAASVSAATVAVGAFAAAAAGQITAITDAVEAEQKYQDAVDQHGASSKQAAEAQNAYVQQIGKMPPATRTAAAALSSLKDQYQDWSDSLASSTMPVATKALQTLSAVFPKLTPLVQGASGQLDRFVTIAAGGVAFPGLDTLISRFSGFSTGALQKANDALIHFVRILDTGKIGGGVSEFMEYVRANGPLVRDTLAKVVEALSNVLTAAANAGPGLLTVVNALAGIVAAVPPGVITTLLQLSLAMKAVRIAAVAMAAVSGGATTFAAAIGAMQTAAAGASGVLPKLAAAFGALSRAAKVALVGTGIGLLAIALTRLSEVGKKAPPDIDRMTTSLGRLAQTGKLSGEAARVLGTDMKGLADAVRGIERPSNLDKVQQSLTKLIGMDSTPVKGWKETIDALDKGLANLVKGGNADMAEELLKRASASMKANGLSTKELTKNLGDYKSALADQAFEQQLAADAMGLFGTQAQQTSEKLDTQKASADGLRQAVQALNDVNRQALGGMVGFEASIDAVAKAAQENAGSLHMVNGQLDLNSPKAQAAATALNDLASKTDEAAAAARENGSSWSTVNGIYTRGREKLIAAATQMGLTRDEAKKLADQILKTPDKTARLRGNMEDLEAKLKLAKEKLAKVPDSRKAELRADIAQLQASITQAKYELSHIPDETVTVYYQQVRNSGYAGNPATGGKAAGGLVRGFPGGGSVRGPGTSVSDSIPTMLSDGEFVIRAAAVRRYGTRTFAALNAMQLPMPRLAVGGAPSTAALGVGSMRPVQAVNVTYAPQIHFTNAGVLGSQRDVQEWFVKTLEAMRLQGRLSGMF